MRRLVFFLCFPLTCLFILAIVGVPRSAVALQVTNAATADTYFETYGSEDQNFGSAKRLRLDQWGGRQVFLRFPLAGLSAERRLIKSTLRLHIEEVGHNEQGEFSDLKTCLGLFDVATPWTETGLTYKSPNGSNSWNQGPGIQGGKYTDVGPLPKPDIGVDLVLPAVPLDPRLLTNGAWLEMDLTSYVRESIRAGKRELNLLLRGSTLSRSFTFSSREVETVAHRPQLVGKVSDSLPDFTLTAPFITDWQKGQAAGIRVTYTAALPADAKPHAKVLSGPVGSRVQTNALTLKDREISFTPDLAGKYQIALAIETPSGLHTSETADFFVLNVPAHPRLYVTTESLAQMQQQVQAGARLSRAFLDWVKAGSSDPASGHFHDMGVHEGCENNALAWLISGSAQALSNSITYARLILRKPMREHFEDIHSATYVGAAWVHAMALHYDWCYDQLSSEHRRAVADWLKEAATWSLVRSPAPIAHNDGGARQVLLASAALALLGDDPNAPALFRNSHRNFTANLLPWLNDGGRGGRSGDGGEYEGLHAFYVVRYAWLAQTATSEDAFSESPFFFNRLNHLLFGWYPRKLVERNGAFAMRQYYSPSGDHIRMGYVGDTQPYQSAAALCNRYRHTAEAKAVRFLAGEWPVRWMQYTLRWAVLGNFDSVPAAQPESLAFLDPGCNTVYARSDWSDDATWILFENAPFVSAHASLDSGTFEIFKGDLLAARTGNLDHGNVGARHSMNYLHRTIAGNCLLIEDPQEKWRGFLGGAEGGPDGGGQRTNFPLGSSPDADTYLTYRDLFQRGQITAFQHEPAFLYTAADLTPAYNNPRIHGGNLNRPKVSNVSRELLYVRGLDCLFVFDRISSLDRTFRKTWLLHSLGDLEVLDGQEARIDDGESRFTGATRAVIRYGWPKPVPSFGRCLSVTLFPENAEVTRIGGRIDLPPGQLEAFPGDPWHGQHPHRHVKDFWVKGTNYPPGNPPELRWFGTPGTEYHVPGTPDESGGRGRWRIEVSPGASALDDSFFHALIPRLGKEGSFPEVTRVSAEAPYLGGTVTESNLTAAVFFPKEAKAQRSFATALPEGKTVTCYIAGLEPGPYQISQGGHKQSINVPREGLVRIGHPGGSLSLRRE